MATNLFLNLLDRREQSDGIDFGGASVAIFASNPAVFGPKQSRTLLQGLGLSRFEIPIDSRITKWLNSFGSPVRLTANAVADPAYYDFVSDGFQRLSEACEIVPCVLDAAIFSSFDGDGWTEENLVW